MRMHSKLARLGIFGAGALGLTALLSSTALIIAPFEGVRAEESFLKSPICHGWSFATAKVIQVAQTEVSPAAQQAAQSTAAFADTKPPIWDGLGTIHYPVTTASKEAQSFFDQGLRLAYAFNHAEAQRAFREAQRLDPQCALCFWGEALVLGPNINLPMQEEAVAPAFAAVTKALALAPKASPSEQGLIAALAKRYAADPKADRAPLDAAYAEAMGKLSAAFPDDDDIATFYAEAVMDLSPWDYWKPGGHDPNPQSAPIVPTLEKVLARNPHHPGAAHYYIHAIEASDRPERAEPYADGLRGAMPAAGHLVHMPSHIYYRVGRYADALQVNRDAVKVDEQYLAATNAPFGVYRLGYYPHNVHFVLVSAQMAGDGATVIAAAEKLSQLIPEEPAKSIAMLQPVKVAPYFAHAQFSPPDKVLALADPGDQIALVKAMWHYARGVAYAATGEAKAAAAEADAIVALGRTGDFSLLTREHVPAADILSIADNVIRARIAEHEGRYPDAVTYFEKAAELQDGLPYMEPPYWYYPVRQSLGAALLKAGKLDEAEEQFEASLKRAPANGWSYYGLMEVYKAKGDAQGASDAEAEIAKSWTGDRKLLQLPNL
jgi:tetratricopeptide (TPR) repeat protein